MYRVMPHIILFFTLANVVFAAPELNKEQQQLKAILSLPEAPNGVLFEVVGGDAQSLEEAIDRAQAYRNKIKSRFSKTKFVLITHGLEQFSLVIDKDEDHPGLHKKVQSLSLAGQMKFEVCGSFADNMGVGQSDFHPAVKVVDAAPAQIEEYRLKDYYIFEMNIE